ncbi:MAG: Gfo/Idh/MocA family oxidoreductase [Polyangiales bacterium]
MNGKFLRGAVVGYGFIAENGHIPAYLSREGDVGDVGIVAVADICEARRALARRNLPPHVRIYSDYAALLAAEAPNLDFVDIACPPHAHAEVAHAALDRGLHVLCEKPIALSIESARSVLDHAQRAKRVFFPCHNYKHAPVIKAVRRIIESGRIGSVRQVTLQTYRNTHAKGVNEWNRDWRRERRFSGGGIAMDHGSHTFYLAFEWLGAYPSAVTAKMTTVGNYDTEDNFSATLTFPNGALATAHLTWTAGVRKVIYTIQGARGAITVIDDDIEVALMQPDPRPDVAQGAVRWEIEKQTIQSNWMDASHVTWFDSLLTQFKSAIQSGDFVGKEAQEAFLCIQAIMTSYASSREGSRELPLAESHKRAPNAPVSNRYGVPRSAPGLETR